MDGDGSKKWHRILLLVRNTKSCCVLDARGDCVVFGIVQYVVKKGVCVKVGNLGVRVGTKEDESEGLDSSVEGADVGGFLLHFGIRRIRTWCAVDGGHIQEHKVPCANVVELLRSGRVNVFLG